MEIVREHTLPVAEIQSGEIYSIRPYSCGGEVVLMAMEDKNFCVLFSEADSDDKVGDIWPRENIDIKHLNRFSGRLVFKG